MAILYISVIIGMRFFQSYFSKRSAILMPNKALPFFGYALFSKAVSTFFAVLLLVIGLVAGNSLAYSGQTLLYASVSGAALVVSTFGSIYSMKSGTVALSSMFSTAGILIPTLLGIYMFDEAVSPIQFVGLGIFFVAAFLLIRSSKKINAKLNVKTVLLLIAIMLATGITMLMQKMFGLYVENGNTTTFSLLTFGSSCALLSLVFLPLWIMHKRKERVMTVSKEADSTQDAENIRQGEHYNLEKRVYLYGAILAFIVFVINQFATLATPLVSSIILFSIINGGATFIAFIVGAVFYKEKITVTSAIAVLMGICSLIMISL